MITDKGTYVPGESWASDTPISMPEVPTSDPVIHFNGFAFTENGMVHALTEVDRQIMLHPAFGPEISPEHGRGD